MKSYSIFRVMNAIAISAVLTACNKGPHLCIGKAEDIARQAEAKNGSTSWAKDVEAKQRGNNKIYPEGSWKCNLFVHDVLYDAGINPPPRTSGGWAATAAMWTNSLPNFKKVSSQKRGDIVSDGTHCGIAVDSFDTISAREEEVVKDSGLSGGTIQRYNDSE